MNQPEVVPGEAEQLVDQGRLFMRLVDREGFTFDEVGQACKIPADEAVILYLLEAFPTVAFRAIAEDWTRERVIRETNAAFTDVLSQEADRLRTQPGPNW